jgi:hypothetical protein
MSLPLIWVAVPLAAPHINAAVCPEGDAFFKEQAPLPGEMRSQPTCVIEHSMAGVLAVSFGPAENEANQPRMALPAGEPGYLPVGGHFPARNFPHRLQDGVDQVFIQQASFHGLFF